MSQDVACDSEAAAGASKVLKIGCRRALVAVLNSRTWYIMKHFHDMVDHSHQKRIWRPWNQCGSICLHLQRHIWNSRTSGASRYRDTRELPLEQRLNIHQAGDPIEKHTDPLKHGYIIIVWNLPFPLERTMCICNPAFKHTTWSTSLSPREADDAGLAQFDFTRSVSHKNWHAHFRDWEWRRLRHLPPR